MKLAPFGLGYSLYRGNLHGHSTHSDGLLSPEAVVNKYIELGYDFTCLSDHLWIDDNYAARSVYDGRALDSKDFITLTSAELHCYGKKYDQDGVWHIVANGLPTDFACPDAKESAIDLIERAKGAGAFVSLAHPEWYTMTTEEALLVSSADAVEIYNHSCVLSSARGSGIAIADFLLNEGYKISFTASDDSHFDLPDFAGGWVMVAAPELSQEAIIAAFKAGQHYSSSGARFNNISIEGGILTVHTTPVQSIVLNGEGHLASVCNGNDITVARFNLSEFDSEWFRITARNSSDQMAWSNPYFKRDLGI